MCAYIKCTYKFPLFFVFLLHALTQQHSNGRIWLRKKFLLTHFKQRKKRKKLFRLIFMLAKENRKNFNFVLTKKTKKSDEEEELEILEARAEEQRKKNEANAFDKQRNTLGKYTAWRRIKLYRNWNVIFDCLLAYCLWLRSESHSTRLHFILNKKIHNLQIAFGLGSRERKIINVLLQFYCYAFELIFF